MAGDRRVEFASGDGTCAADLRLPEGSDPAGPAGAGEVPLVLLAHGFGLPRSAGLERYARRFRERGLATLTFDHRGFGEASGPRGLIHPGRHREDWLAAVDAARSLPEVDGGRLGLWGTSFSAGHAVEAAARRDIAALAVQVPFADGLATLRHAARNAGPAAVARAVAHGALDLALAGVGRGPHTVPIVGPPDTFALINAPGAQEAYRELLPSGADWPNACPARVTWLLPAYRPLRRAGQVDAPAFVAYAEEDRILPAGAARALAEALDAREVRALEADHWAAYREPAFGSLVEAQAGFLERALAPGGDR